MVGSYATQRPEVTRMKDRDGDGRADVLKQLRMIGELMVIIMSMLLEPAMIRMEIYG